MIIINAGTGTLPLIDIIPELYNRASGVIIIVGDSTTDTSSWHDFNSSTSAPDLCSLMESSSMIRPYAEEDVFSPQYYNGLKATETMRVMGRMYEPRKHKNHHREAFKINKRMFCESGYLPKRIRSIRK